MATVPNAKRKTNELSILVENDRLILRLLHARSSFFPPKDDVVEIVMIMVLVHVVDVVVLAVVVMRASSAAGGSVHTHQAIAHHGKGLFHEQFLDKNTRRNKRKTRMEKKKANKHNMNKSKTDTPPISVTSNSANASISSEFVIFIFRNNVRQTSLALV